MAFKGLTDRFEARMNEVYGGRSNRVDGSDEPYMETKITDSNRSDRGGDSRSFPRHSTTRDLSRLTNYLKSDRGKFFLVKQGLLQTGNAIAETRLINPLFVLRNAVPFSHAPRVLRTPADYAFNNEDGLAPDSMDPKIGHAGRMQKATAKEATAKIVGSKGISGLLGLLGVNQVLDTVRGALLIGEGATGMNERPELNVAGEYYSIRMWKGTRRQRSIEDDLRNIQSSIRTGNVRGLVNSVTNAINDATSTLGTTVGNNSMEARNRPWTTEFYGRRYFITGPSTADRYLKDHGGDSSTIRPDVSLRYDAFPILGDLPRMPKSDVVTTIGTFANRVGRSVGNAFSSAVPSVNLPTPVSSNTLNSIAGAFGAAAESINDEANPVYKHKLTFPSASVQAHYEDANHLQVIKDQLKVQKDRQFEYWQKELPMNTARSIQVGTLIPGRETNINATTRNAVGGYKDLKNLNAPIITNVSANNVTKAVRDQTGDDFIDVIFYDVANRTALPFRAYVSGLTQQTNVEVTDQRYIGRTERHIVYTGAARDMNFQLRVHAFSPGELANIWTKADYLTGLCFPATYDRGFMVPPLVRLTIGNVLRDQPGIIRSLTVSVEEDGRWETQVEHAQVPHGLIFNVSFSIIEKNAMSSKGVANGRRFFGFGRPITQG